MTDEDWRPNELARHARLYVVVFPLVSLLVLLLYFEILPSLRGGVPDTWVGGVAALVPLLLIPWAITLDLMLPRHIRLDPTNLLWKDAFGKVSEIPRHRVLRLSPLSRRSRVIMVVFLDSVGRERRLPVTTTNAAAVGGWLAAS